MKKRMLGLLLVLALLAAALCTTVLAAGGAVYVSAGGSDTTGDGSQTSPYATLTKAVEVAEDGSTIYVMSDLTMTKCARFFSKSLTITSGNGGPYTITRSDSFETINDTARSWYNPAMIEVQTTSKGAGLTLTNIILDDTFSHEGTVFAQAISGEGNDHNTDYVQDAMIASNATYPTTITLGDGAVLQNFGGMSAVRVTDKATLVMKSGSVIEDTDSHTTRERGSSMVAGADKQVGPAGAVWIQGASFEMEAGAKIQNVDGRAVYVDGGSATIGGTISGIKANSQMWQGKEGVAIHLRGNAVARLTKTGRIEKVETSVENTTVVKLSGGTYTMDAGSVMSGNAGNNIAAFGNTNSVYMNGEITGIPSGAINSNAINLQADYETTDPVYCEIGATGNIHDNYVWYGSVYVQGHSVELHHYGKINNNHSTSKAGGIVLANNYVGAKVFMYDGAEIIGNESNDDGAGVMVSCGTFTMKGGKISENIAKGQAGGVYVRRGGQFIMEGGEISNNHAKTYGGGVAYVATNYGAKPEYGVLNFIPYVSLKNGTISGNTMGTSSDSNDLGISSSEYGYIDRYFFISDDMTIGNKAVYFEKESKTVTPADNSFDIKLGNASSSAISHAQSAAGFRSWRWRDTFWAQRDGAATLTVGGPTTLDDTLPVYVLTLPVPANGKLTTVYEPEAAKCYAATRTAGGVQFTIPEADLAGNGCAISIVQPTNDYGTLGITAPESITENETGDDYTVTYTVTYTISDSLTNIIKESNKNATYTLALSPDTRLTGTVDTSSFDGENNSITVTYTLPNSKFAANKRLCTSAVLTVTVGGLDYVIPSNVAETKMLPLFPDEDEPDQPTGGFFFPMGEEHLAYVSGYPDGTVRPEANITRAESAAMLYRLMPRGYFASGAQTPADVTTSDWYYSIVSQMIGSGYLTGYADGTFRGNNNVTRAEFVTMLVRLSGARGGWCSFADVSSAHWAYDAISTAAAEGWIGGYADGSFRPDQAITRAEAMTIINRALDRGVDETSWLDDYIRWPDNPRDAWYYYEVIEATNDHYYTGSRPSEDWVG